MVQFPYWNLCRYRSGKMCDWLEKSGMSGNFVLEDLYEPCTELGNDIGWLLRHCTFSSEFGYLVAFSNAGGSKLSDVENNAKFCTFCPPPLWKLEEEWARSRYQLLKLYLRPNLRNTFDGHPLCGFWAEWIDKKNKKK